jgi:hypothetical protein
MTERGSYSRLQKEGAMTPHPSFNPEQFALCYRAYTAALLDIQYEKGRANQKPPGNTTCLTVALRIIEASANGERDASRLKQFALHEIGASHP